MAVVLLVSAGCSDPAVDTGGPHVTPTGAPWPSYEPSDYTYVLGTQCFCAGDKVRVTVENGEVESVVYATEGSEHAAGDEVPADATWLRLSINDVIDLANDPEIAEAQVRWPEDLDHPTRIWIDRDKNAIDEEIGYTITHVHPT